MSPVGSVPAGVRRILVIKLRAIGDVLLSTIVLKNLRLAFPDAAVDFLTESPSATLLRRTLDRGEVVVYDRRAMTGLDLIRRVRSGSYDLVIDLFGNPRTALVTRLSGAPHRVGYRFRGRTYAYTTVVTPRGGEVHNTQFNLDALEAIGVPIRDRTVSLHLGDQDRRTAETFLAGSCSGPGMLVALNPSGGWYTKRWSLEKFAALGDRLVDRFKAQIILPWGPGELSDVEKIQRAMRHAAVIPPETTLLELAGLLERMAFVVTNDSGPMHLAAAVGTPVLGIYGPTNPMLQGPYGDRHRTIRLDGLECLGCNLTRCPIGHVCMRDLTVERVGDAVEQLMNDLGIHQ